MIRLPFSARSLSRRLPPLALALGALHCSDGALVFQGSPAPPGPLPPTAEPPGEPVAVGMDPEPSGASAPNPAVASGEGSTSRPIAPIAGAAAAEPSMAAPSSGGTTSADCQPRGVGGPFWLTEGEAIQIPIECASGAALDGADVLFGNLPPNATFDPATARLSFAPGLDQAGVYAIDLGIAGSAERSSLEVQVADRFDAAGNLPVNPSTYTEELGLPVLHLTTDPGINDGDYLPATITYRGHTFSGAEAKFRGATSLRYPKNSFTLKFTKEDRFGEPTVAGFAEKRKITLTTTFDDNSNLRARLAFELWNRVDDGRAKVLAYNAVVYLNGAFWGIYTITDHIDGRLMEDYGYYQDGNLYKARTHDANFRLTLADDPTVPKESLSEGFTKEEGTPLEGEPGANADLEDLVSWVATSSSDAFNAELGSRVTLNEYEGWWMLVSLVFAGDSAGKNSYHYRDPRAGADNRFHVLPWDFNDSFGQTFYNDHPGREADRDPELLASYCLLFERMLAEPSLREPLIGQYRSLLENEWALPSVLDRFDAWAAENEPVALRDERKWGASFAAYFADMRSTSPVDHAAEMAYLRQWIIDRWNFVADYY